MLRVSVVASAAIDWTPIPSGALEAHALRQVFGPLHPLAAVGKYEWRPHEAQARPDQLRVPVLADVDAVATEAPKVAQALRAPLAPPSPVLADLGGVYRN